MTLEIGLIVFAAAAALAHGVLLAVRAPWPLKSAARLLALAGLTAVAIVDAAPATLIAGLAFAAVCEGLLAGRSSWRIPLGLTAILASNLAYALLFGVYGAGRVALEAEGWRAVGVFGAPALAAMALTWVWPKVASHKRLILFITYAAGLMAAMAFTLSHALWTAMPGAVLVMAASIGTARLAMDAPRREGRCALVWAINLIGQALIAYAFLH